MPHVRFIKLLPLVSNFKTSLKNRWISSNPYIYIYFKSCLPNFTSFNLEHIVPLHPVISGLVERLLQMSEKRWNNKEHGYEVFY